LEDKLTVLREGRSTMSIYRTTFMLRWPRHLGGGVANISFEGSMALIPTMGTA
jgi:hypothetical protein